MNHVAFVTGAAGFLGRNLLEVLRDAHWQVHVLLRGEVPAWMRHWPNLVITHGALDDASAVQRAMPPQCDAVFHLAGNTSSWTGDAPAIYRDNVLATRNITQAAVVTGARRLVATSTLGVFQTTHGPIHEHTPLLTTATRNPYLHTKLQADALLSEAQQRGLSVVRMHPGHILGRYDRSGWISLFTQAQAGQLGPAPRGRASFCLASDVALAHLRAALLPQAAPRYILASADASYVALFNAIALRTGRQPVTATVPGVVLKTMAMLSLWHAALTGTKPTITLGLAAILSSDLLAQTALASRDLGLGVTPLDAMLEETHTYWHTHLR